MAAIRTQKEIRQRAPWWLVGVLLFNFGLMAYDAHEQGDPGRQRVVRAWAQAIVAPFQKITSGAGGLGVGAFQWIDNLRRAGAENEQLRQRVEQMEIQLRQSRAAVDENERLKGLLDLRDQKSYGVVAARVIARDPSAWFGTIMIDRGSNSGIELSMPVVTPGGIVGRVIAVSPWTAQVMLITHERAAAGAVVGQLGASNALGSIKGFGKNGLVEMNYVSGMEKVDVGDYVVTTGQDAIYPSGLNVGEVVSVRPGSATQPHVIYVKPSARLDSLQEVAVLLYHPVPRVEPEQALPNVNRSKSKGR